MSQNQNHTTEELPLGIVYAVLMLDELVHTDETPFCSDMTCGCHSDRLLNDEYLFRPWYEGLMTTDETQTLWSGRTV